MGFFKQIDDDQAQVALWRITETEEELKALTGLDLSEKYAYPRRRLEVMVVRVLLNHLNHFEQISYHSNGRPYFSNNNPHISISHTAKMVAVAFSYKYNVGVDVERVNRDFGEVAYKYLSEEEFKWVDLTDQKLLALIWCIKESVYKLPWDKPKIFSTEINVPKISNVGDEGVVSVEVIDLGRKIYLDLKYLFFDEFCLSWVLNNHK